MAWVKSIDVGNYGIWGKQSMADGALRTAVIQLNKAHTFLGATAIL